MNADDNPLERREIHFTGQVQGVGFRYTARSVARGHQVTGFVRNLADGRVEVVVEGSRQAIDGFVAELGRVMQDYIRNVTTTTLPPTGEFDGFGIRF